MNKKTATVLMVVAGIVIGAGILLVAGLFWFFTSAVETARLDRAAAVISFEDIRARFKGASPILEVEPGGARVTRPPPDQRPTADLQRVHMLAWNADDEALARVTLPFWLLRLKSGPINISAQSAVAGVRISMTVEELERYGPALLLDHMEEDGTRVLVWTE